MAAEDYFDFDWDDNEARSQDGWNFKPRTTRMGTLVAPTLFETPKAWKVKVGRDEIWLPKSQCSRRNEGMGGDTYSIPEWLVDRIGIDQYVEFD